MNIIKKAVIAGIITWFATGNLVIAAEGEELLKGKDCFACHKLDAKSVGPSYKEVAAKYKGDATAKENLVKKIKTGGAGNWGKMMMPPHPTMKDEELNKIVEWILSL